MFGYVVMNKPEIKFKDFDLYRSFYCGLCRELRDRYGVTGQISLTYDMTFVILLLSGLYEPPTRKGTTRCIIHPVRKQPVRKNAITEYAADMNVFLAYYKCEDDWKDEKKLLSLLYGNLLRGKEKHAEERWRKKVDTIVSLLNELSEMEKAGEENIDCISGCFGKIMEEIFAYRADLWEPTLRRMGFFLGKFIYLMDAYDDVEEDIKKGKLTEDKDIRFCNKGFFAARNYTIEETSGTRPAELMVTEPWVSTPESVEQKQYSETEAVYRAFVYDTYRDVDPETRDLVQQMFWDDYESDSDGIYSSICRIRDVLKENVEYTENIEEVPDGEDLVRYFLTGSQRGNAMLYASAAVDALRVHGIPARYVEGYYISESDLKNSQSEEIILTGENTHAWAEAYFDGIGWLPLDVTPGYYYDAVTLQKMVSTPDVAQKNAVLKDNSFGSQEVTGLDGAGGKSARERLTRAARDVGAICLGIVAVLLILFVAVIIVCEVIRNVCLWTDRKADRGASPREKILRTEKKIYSYLALVGIRARLGWNTEETDRLIADFFEEIESGEYTRVCNLIEKVIYGEIELEPHEERTVTSFLNKLLTSQKFMDRRAWLRRRYTYVWMNRK